MTASIQLSSNKLSKIKINAIQSDKILEGGAVKTVCFDKTGTLTELELKLFGFQIREKSEFANFSKKLENFYNLENFENLIRGVITCHSLTIYENKVIGDPLEETLFENVNGILKEKKNPYKEDEIINTVSLSTEFKVILKKSLNHEYLILDIIEFTSERKRMGVMIQDSSTHEVFYYCKGAPEIIKDCCLANTIPENYDDILNSYSDKGLRIISLSMKKINHYRPLQNIDGDSLDQNLIFIGFLIFENPLKKSTKPTILKLKDKLYETVMITGDNIFTAIHTGYSCGILNEKDTLWIGVYEKKEIKWLNYE